MNTQSNAEFERTPLEFRNGPLPNDIRGKTDIFFCALITISFIGVVCIGAYAFHNGNPYRIVQGYDPDRKSDF